MRRIFFITVAVVLTSLEVEGQAASGPQGLACFENFSTPEYPRSALEAQVDGSVWATVHVSPQATIDRIDTLVVSAWSQGQKLLAPPVEQAIRAAKVKPECANKDVSVVVQYHLWGDPVADPKIQSRTDAPNVIAIESQPAIATKTQTR